MRVSVIICGTILLIATSVYGRTIHVPGDSSTIQAGINGAVAGDTVLVADGTYTGSGNRDLDYQAKAIVVISEHGPEATIIDCEDVANSRGFIFHSGETPDSKLNGFTLTNSRPPYPAGCIDCRDSSPTIANCIIWANEGDAIYCERSLSIIKNCLISGNYQGSGINCSNGSLTVKNCTITKNWSVGGGGIACWDSPSYFDSCTISENIALHDGGGIWCSSSSPSLSPTFANCTISGNTAEDFGGGIWCTSSSPNIGNCTISMNEAPVGGGLFCSESAFPNINDSYITQNTAHIFGGGVYCQYGSYPSITNCTIVENDAPSGGGIYHYSGPSPPILNNCLISGNGGGGIKCWDSSITIFECTIVENQEYGIECTGNCTLDINGSTISNNNGSAINGLPLVSIVDCIITGNNGGGIGCSSDDSSSSIINCTISENTGWGIGCSGASSTHITNCSVTSNIYGGISCSGYSSPMITNCDISWNSSLLWGGGIWCSGGASATVKNCIISWNQSDWWGGGILCQDAASATIINCTITQNKSENYGGGVYCLDSSSSVIKNCILWNDSPEEIFQSSGSPIVTYTDVKGGWVGEGNINVDPLFRDADSSDYHLMATYCSDPCDSPCIDAGHPNILDDLLDCFHGLGTNRSDMGAYGGDNSGWPTEVEDDEESDVSPIPNDLLLYQNYPNPFNPETWIRYQVPELSTVTIRVYNVAGQLVNTLVNGKQTPGNYRVLWSGRDLHGAPVASGVYFCKLTAGTFDKTIKMVLVK